MEGVNTVINDCKEEFGHLFAKDEESVIIELFQNGKCLIWVNDGRLNNRRFHYKIKDYIENNYPNIEFQNLYFPIQGDKDKTEIITGLGVIIK